MLKIFVKMILMIDLKAEKILREGCHFAEKIPPQEVEK